MVRLLLLVFVSLLAREVSAISQEKMNFDFEQSECYQPLELDVCDNVGKECSYSICCNGLAEPVGSEEGVCLADGDLPVIALGGACDISPCAGICDKANGAFCENSVCAVPFAGPFFCVCTEDKDCNTDETCQTLGVNRVEKWCFPQNADLPPEPSTDTLEGDSCATNEFGSTCGDSWSCMEDSGVKLCQELAAVGEDCSWDNANCLSGWCFDNTCQEMAVALGEECSLVGQECEAGYCNDESPRICAAQLSAGDLCTGGDSCESGRCEGTPRECTASPVSGATCDYLSTSTYDCMEGERCNTVDQSQSGTGVCEVLTACDYDLECDAPKKCVSDGISGFCISKGLADDGDSCDSSQECAVDLACIMTYFEPVGAQGWKMGVCGAFGSGDADGDACKIAKGVDAVCGGPYFWDYTDSCNDGSVCMMSGSIASGVPTTFKCSEIAAVADGCEDVNGENYYKTSDMNGLCTDKKIGSPCKASDWEHTSDCDKDLGTYCDIPVSDAADFGGIGVCAQGPLLEGAYCFDKDELCGDDLYCDDSTYLCIDAAAAATYSTLSLSSAFEAVTAKYGPSGLAEGETCQRDDDCAFLLMCSCVGNAGVFECVNQYEYIPEEVDPLDSNNHCLAETTAKSEYIETQCSLDSRTPTQQTCGYPQTFDKEACYNDLDQGALDGYDVALACCWVCRHTDTLTTLSDLTVALEDSGGSSILFRDYGSIVDCSAGTITRALEFEDFCTDLDISKVFLKCPTYSSTGTIVFSAGTRATHFGMLVGAVLAVGAYGVAQ